MHLHKALKKMIQVMLNHFYRSAKHEVLYSSDSMLIESFSCGSSTILCLQLNNAAPGVLRVLSGRPFRAIFTVRDPRDVVVSGDISSTLSQSYVPLAWMASSRLVHYGSVSTLKLRK